MAKSVITGKDADELLLLYAALRDLGTKVEAALRKHGPESHQFLEADTALGKAINRIREIRGLGGASWL